MISVRKRGRRTARVASTAIACLLVGVLGTYAIAWLGARSTWADDWWSGSAAFSPRLTTLGEGLTPAELDWISDRTGTRLDARLVYPRSVGGTVAWNTSLELVEFEGPFANPICGVGLEGELARFKAEHPGPQLEGSVYVTRISAGWPARALAGTRFHLDLELLPLQRRRDSEKPFDDTNHGVLDAIEIGESPWLDSPTLYPTRILWTGLVGDSLLLGVVAWSVFAGVPFVVTARRRSRRRRGCCIACGYDLRGSQGEPCPECHATANR